MRKLYFVMVGSVIDSLGSNGFTYAMGTVLLVRYPCLTNLVTDLMAVQIAVMLIGFAGGTVIMSKCGYGLSTVVGNVAAVVFQVLIAYAVEPSGALFIAFTFIGNALSMQSMLTTNPMIMKVKQTI
jgi:hypothetical protein